MNAIPGLSAENLILILLSYGLIYLLKRKFDHQSILLLFGILTFHHVVAYLYAFYLSTPPNELDHISFIQLAGVCAKTGYCGYFGEHLYANYLAKVMFFGQSVYIVYLVNVLFFVVSLYYILAIADEIKLEGNRRLFTFIYGMWPSVVYFTTLGYRETFELYLLIAGVYYGLAGSRADSFIKMFVSMILLYVMGIFHMKGLTYLSPLLFLILMSYKFSFSFISVAKKLSLVVVMAVAVYFSQGMYAGYLNGVSKAEHTSKQTVHVDATSAAKPDSLSKPVEKEPLSGNRLLFENNKDAWLEAKNYPDAEPGIIDTFMRKVTFYRASLSWVRVPNTLYLGEISDSSIPAFIFTYFLEYLEYLSSPFIFQVNSSLSLLAYLESLVRVLLFVSALVLVKRFPQARVLFVIYLATTAMWTLGIVSFGAGIRHHVQTNWILVLLGVPVISGYLSGKFRSSSS